MISHPDSKAVRVLMQNEPPSPQMRGPVHVPGPRLWRSMPYQINCEPRPCPCLDSRSTMEPQVLEPPSSFELALTMCAVHMWTRMWEQFKPQQTFRGPRARPLALAGSQKPRRTRSRRRYSARSSLTELADLNTCGHVRAPAQVVLSSQHSTPQV